MPEWQIQEDIYKSHYVEVSTMIVVFRVCVIIQK
jgi:hypothetical protein